MQENSDISQVCWIRVGALGDLLVALAALELTHKKFSNAKVIVVGPKLWLELLNPSLWPRVNGIFVVNARAKGDFYVPNEGGWDLHEKDANLRSIFSRCQASVNHRVESYRYAWPAFFAGVKVRYGTCPWPMKWLYTNWSPWLGKDPIIHERDRHLRILEAPKTTLLPLGCTQKNRDQLKFEQTGVIGQKPDKYKVHNPRSLPNIVKQEGAFVEDKGLTTKSFWLVNPTSSRWEKAWDKNKFKEFCKILISIAERFEKQVFVIGAPNETEWLNFVADGSLKVIQPASLRELSQWVANAELLITNTSSVQYIAATTKTPAFVLMGRTFPARWGPLGEHDHFIAGKVPPSFSGNIFEEDYAGYDSIAVETAVKEFETWRKSF